MGYKQDKMVERATRAIHAVNNDTSATLEQVLDALVAIREELE